MKLGMARRNKRYIRGFTLIELLVVVALLGIISGIAIPSYIGYIDTARANVAKDNLRNIYLQQQEYFTDNNAYYNVGTAPCATDNSANINNNLFAGQQIITGDYYYYCIVSTDATADFTAHATLITDATVDYTITNNNVDNF